MKTGPRWFIRSRAPLSRGALSRRAWGSLHLGALEEWYAAKGTMNDIDSAPVYSISRLAQTTTNLDYVERAGHSNSGSLAILAVIRRASALLIVDF
jgi:hypothetical protein